MRVRLSFARAILCRPKLLFLDEPTTGLDPLSARRIKDLILEQRDGGATVFSSPLFFPVRHRHPGGATVAAPSGRGGCA